MLSGSNTLQVLLQFHRIFLKTCLPGFQCLFGTYFSVSDLQQLIIEESGSTIAYLTLGVSKHACQICSQKSFSFFHLQILFGRRLEPQITAFMSFHSLQLTLPGEGQSALTNKIWTE